MPNEPSFTDLHRALIDRYDLEELRTLCAQLGIPFDDLRGEGRSAKARELILWRNRSGGSPLANFKQISNIPLTLH